MLLFNLNKSTNRKAIFVLISLSSFVIAFTIIFVVILINFNYDKEEAEIHEKVVRFSNSVKNYFNTLNKELAEQTSILLKNYSLYKKNEINKKVFLKSSNDLIINAIKNNTNGFGFGYWFEPYIIDTSRYFGYYAYRYKDKIILTDDYNSYEYNYHAQNWYTNVLPMDWDRKLPLIEKYNWSNIFFDSAYTNKKMMTLGMPIYDLSNQIIGITTLDISDNDFSKIKELSESIHELEFFLKRSADSNFIYSSESVNINYNSHNLFDIINQQRDSNLVINEITLQDKQYLIYIINFDPDFVLSVLIPKSTFYKSIYNQIYLIIAFSILIIALIYIGFRYAYRTILQQSNTNERLMEYYKNLITLSPNLLAIFDESGKLIEYNSNFMNSFANLITDNINLNQFIKKLLLVDVALDKIPDNLNKLNDCRFYDSINKKYFLTKYNSFNVEKTKNYFFIIIDITDIKNRENEIDSLNRNLEVIIQKRTSQLEEAMKSLQALNRKLSKHTENLQVLNDELMTSESKLKESVETKDRFLSIMAHDIKNPIHSANMIIDLLNNYQQLMRPDEISGYYQKINKTLNSVSRLIEDILLWSKAQSNKLLIDQEKINLNEFIQNEIKIFDSQISEKMIQLNVDIQADTFVLADRNMISTIIRNLISNAIKFFLAESEIIVSCQANPTESKVVILIEDMGIGMDEITKNNLFNIGMNTTRKGTAGETGTGIGLLLSFEFVKTMKQKIWVISNENQGTKFFFTLNKVLIEKS